MSLLEFAVKDIEYSFKHLEFAVKLMCYCESGHLDKSKFDTDITVLLPSENLSFPANSFENQESIIKAAQSQVGVCFGVTAVAMDAAYEAAGIRNNPQSREPSDQLRSLIYMVRCTFAHNFAAPAWKTTGPDYARIFNIVLCSGVVEIDLTNLNGEFFDYEHVGGVAQWLRIKSAVMEALNGT